MAKIVLVALGLMFAPPQSTREYFQHMVGQRLILRHFAGSSNPIVKGKDLSSTKRGCDEAVEVTAIAFEKSSILFQLRNIGVPSIGKKSDACAKADMYSFRIIDFDINQPREQVESAIGQVLQTPEAYLAALGIQWDPPPFVENEAPVDPSRPGLTAAKVLLSVNPYYSHANREAHVQGSLTITCSVGTDGLIHDPVIKQGLTEELNKLALDALTFWRIQPARDGAHAVPIKAIQQFSFRLY